ncbi:helix-turn-helix domain-containing protein [Micromonospora sp. WMMD1274]|uniref:helix-turn-helix domain-containing protein n=1 Tax=Micromonospora sp. WMMD1274 TaxID=3404116 RepID=UPI003B947120
MQPGVPGGLVLGLGSGQFLAGPVGALYLARALAVAERVAARDGVRPPADFVALRAVVDVAAAEARAAATGSLEVPATPHGAQSEVIGSDPVVLVDPVDVREAAALLGCSTRNVRAHCRRGAFATARRRPGGWLLERADVLARLSRPAATNSNP